MSVYPALHVVENDGRGDCLFYAFLYPIFNHLGKMDVYNKNKKKLAKGLRIILSNISKLYHVDEQAAEDLEEIGMNGTYVQSYLIKYLSSYCGMGVHLFMDLGGKSHIDYFSSTISDLCILIEYKDLHYRCIGYHNRYVFTTNDPIIQDLYDKYKEGRQAMYFFAK
jgi:hypothetical protein